MDDEAVPELVAQIEDVITSYPTHYRFDGEAFPLVRYVNGERIVYGEGVIEETEDGLRYRAKLNGDASSEFLSGQMIAALSIGPSVFGTEAELRLSQMDYLHQTAGTWDQWRYSTRRMRLMAKQVDIQAVYDNLRKRGFITPKQKQPPVGLMRYGIDYGEDSSLGILPRG